MVDLEAAEPTEVPLVCDPVFDSPTGRILPSGDLAVSADKRKIFVVTEARPHLSIIDIEATDTSQVQEVSYLEDGESFPNFNVADERLQFQNRSPEAPLTLRDRFDWFQGLLRWQEHVGLVFRRWDGEQVKFLLDLFDTNGQKMANDLLLELQPPTGTLDRLAHLTMLNGPEGKVWIFVRNRDAQGRITWQQLFQVTLAVPEDRTASTDTNLRFRLADLTTGAPIESARLTLRASGQHRILNLERTNGSFATAIPPGTSTRIEIDSNGYRKSNLEFVATDTEPTDLGTLYLDPGVSVQGTLLHPDTGEPVAGATLSSVRPAQWGGLTARHFGWQTSVETDAQGNFYLSGLDPGTQCLEVRHPEFTPWPLILEQLEPDERRELGVIAASSRTQVTVRVVDLATRDRPGAEVELRAGSLHQPCVRLTETTGDDGIAEFTDVAPGEYLVVARSHGVIQAVQPVTIEAVEQQQLDDLILALQHVQGSVKLEGVPVQAGLLVLTPPTSGTFNPPPVFIQRSNRGQQLVNDLQPSIVAQVTSEGSFAAEGYLPPGQILATFTTADGLELRQVLPPLASAPLAGQRLELNFSGSPVQGKVVTATGEPVSGAWMQLRSMSPELQGIDLRAGASAVDGTFILPKVPPGQYRLSGTMRTGSTALTGEESIDVKGSTYYTELELRQQPPRELAVRIISTTGSAADGAAVLASNGERVHVIQTTDADGWAYFRGLQPGRYYVLAAHAGGLYEGQTTHLGSTDSSTAVIYLDEAEPANIRFPAPTAIGKSVHLKTPNGVSVQPLLGFLGLTPRVDWGGEVDLPLLSPGIWQAELVHPKP